MQHLQHRTRLSVCNVAIIFALGGCLVGCAASEKASFTNHLAATVEPGTAGNRDVIMAFSLEPAVPASAVARGERAQVDD